MYRATDPPLIEESLEEQAGAPVWEIAHLFPNQGEWSEEDYLALDTNRLVEYSHGYLEVLPMPTPAHQFIVLHLYRLLWSFIKSGQLLVAPVRVKLWAGKFREPDIVYIAAENQVRIEAKYLNGADLVMEVVSQESEDRRRDLVTKRKEYALAAIPEYWIVDALEQRITVLRLDDEEYVVHGEFKAGEEASSALLEGFMVDVTAVLNAAPSSPDN
jgi:Uma2 family endonuclease